MNFLKIIISALALLLIAKITFAADPNLEDIKARKFLDQERRDIVRQKENQEIDNIGRSKTSINLNDKSKKILDDTRCKEIKEIKISGNKEVFSYTLNRKFIKPNFNSSKSCLTKADLAKIQNDITNYYLKEGYSLARVYFDVSKLKEGIMSFIIEEGKLAKLEIADNSKLNDILAFRRKTQKFSAFPYFSFLQTPIKKNPDCLEDEEEKIDGKVINLRDVEQGLDQMNRLSSNKATMKIDSSDQDGYSNITIDNQIGHLSNLALIFDNSGNKSTGKEKRKISLNQDNLLGLNDNIYLNYSVSNGTSIFGSDRFDSSLGIDKNDSRFSKAFYSSFSIPFGYYTIGASYAYSKYMLTTSGTAGKAVSTGNSENKTYYVDKVLSRGQKYKISFKGELEENDVDTYYEDVYQPNNSRKITKANFYLSNVFYFPNGSIYIQPKISKGLTMWRAKKDERNLTADKPRAQFNTYGIYGRSNFNFDIPKTKIPLNHQLTFEVQQSEDSLFGSEQMNIGGQYSVRGFQESSISGDNGYYVRNDLSAKVSDLLPNFLIANKLAKFGGDNFSLASFFDKSRFTIFYDFGYVRNHVIDYDTDEGHMSGAGAAFKFSGNNVDFDVTYSKGLHSPRFLRNIDNLSPDNETIYFSLSFKMGIF